MNLLKVDNVGLQALDLLRPCAHVREIAILERVRQLLLRQLLRITHDLKCTKIGIG